MSWTEKTCLKIMIDCDLRVLFCLCSESEKAPVKMSMYQENEDPFPTCFGVFGYFRIIWTHLMKCTNIFRAKFQILLHLWKWQISVASTGYYKYMLDLDFGLLQVPVLNQESSRVGSQWQKDVWSFSGGGDKCLLTFFLEVGTFKGLAFNFIIAQCISCMYLSVESLRTILSLLNISI